MVHFALLIASIYVVAVAANFVFKFICWLPAVFEAFFSGTVNGRHPSYYD